MGYMHLTKHDRVRDFHEAFGHPVNAKWTPELIELRVKLIAEECSEALQELYSSADYINLFGGDWNKSNNMIPVDQKVALTKELCDILVVVYGTAVALGLPIDAAFNRVHESNMSKLGNDGKPVLREDGKILKGPNYKEPDLTSLFVTK